MSSDYRKKIQDLSTFVKQLDESIRLEAFKFLLARELESDGPHPAANIQRAVSAQTDSARPVAPQELIRRSGVSKFTEKAVVLAYWLEEFDGRSTFSSGDLKAAFEAAREHAPKNPSDMVAKLEASARVMKAEKAGGVQRYRLTSSAIHDVQRWLGTSTHETD